MSGNSQYVCRWEGEKDIQKSEHKNENGARRKALKISKDGGYAQAAQVNGTSILKKWTYENGDLIKVEPSNELKMATKKRGVQELAKVPEPKVKGIALEFGVGVKTNRMVVLKLLSSKINHPVPLIDLIKGVYGEAGTIADRGKINMVIKGLKFTIEKKGLGYEITNQKVNNTPTIRLGEAA